MSPAALRPFARSRAPGGRRALKLLTPPKPLMALIPLILPVARLAAVFVAGALVAGCAGSSSNWAGQPQRTEPLDELARVSVPAAFAADPRVTERTADWVSWHFRRHYRSHLNGQSSWSEAINVVLFAPDLPRDRIDRLLARGLPRMHEVGWGPRPGLGEPDARGLRWLVKEQVYERDPVREPSWFVRLEDPAAGIVIGWRGFAKDYTLEAAKKNLAALRDGLVLTGDLAADFARRRSWPREGWEASYAARLQSARTVLAEAGLPLEPTGAMGRKGPWRVIVDDERPQMLHLVHFVRSEPVPAFPFALAGPLTYYRFIQRRWVQENQGGEGGRLPEDAQALLAPDFADERRIYFYRILSIDLWRAATGERALTEEFRSALRRVAADSALHAGQRVEPAARY